jgi:hypothetical protein
MPQLKTIVISWTDLTGSGFWDMKASILHEFRQSRKGGRLRSRSIRFSVGKIVVADEEEQDQISATIESLMAEPELEDSAQPPAQPLVL